MNSNIWKTIKLATGVFILIVLSKVIDGIPWWGFTVPVMILGSIAGALKWDVPFFTIGFSVGFIVWFVGNGYIDQMSDKGVLDMIGHAISLPKLVILAVAGLLGGLITGLAFYTGKSAFAPSKITALDTKINLPPF